MKYELLVMLHIDRCKGSRKRWSELSLPGLYYFLLFPVCIYTCLIWLKFKLIFIFHLWAVLVLIASGLELFSLLWSNLRCYTYLFEIICLSTILYLQSSFTCLALLFLFVGQCNLLNSPGCFIDIFCKIMSFNPLMTS